MLLVCQPRVSSLCGQWSILLGHHGPECSVSATSVSQDLNMCTVNLFFTRFCDSQVSKMSELNWFSDVF